MMWFMNVGFECKVCCSGHIFIECRSFFVKEMQSVDASPNFI